LGQTQLHKTGLHGEVYSFFISLLQFNSRT